MKSTQDVNHFHVALRTICPSMALVTENSIMLTMLLVVDRDFMFPLFGEWVGEWDGDLGLCNEKLGTCQKLLILKMFLLLKSHITEKFCSENDLLIETIANSSCTSLAIEIPASQLPSIVSKN